MATIHIDNQPYAVDDRQNLLQQCLTLGFDLPYFCWHPAMGSVGACRQCAVKQFKDEHDTRGKIVMACMVAARDGTRISITDTEAHEFRQSITEWMMVNHPHDCPVCDEGGECHLQDMTVMTGHVYRRYRGLKRTFHNQDLGPLVNHEMNRCIQCYRCTRFYRDYAGGRDFDALVLRDNVYFGRDRDGTLESEFSGNLVEVCPTGVFTDKSLKRHYSRKWDLQTAPSICVHCSVGCNTIPGERYGLLRRIRNRYNFEVNGYFLCDRGRYGYEFVNSERRLRQCMLRPRRDAPLQGAAADQVLQHLGSLLGSNARMIGIGSPRASLEANFALRTLVGAERFHSGVAAHEAGLLARVLDILRDGPARTPSLGEIGQADAVLILGEDVSNTAPMMALALRQAVRQQPQRAIEKLHIPSWDDHAVREAIQKRHGPLFIASMSATRLDDIATDIFRGAPADLARLGHAVANALDADAPAVAGLSDEMRALAAAIASALRTAERPLVLSGSGCGDAAVIDAAANVAQALIKCGRPAALAFAVAECNSLGAALLGGASLEAAFDAVRSGAAENVVILENDLYRRADAAAVDAFLATARHIVVIDHLAHASGEKADVVLPAATFAEGDGTLVNHEGRAQRYFQVFVPNGEIRESWRWVEAMAAAAGRGGTARSLDEMIAACAAALPQFAAIVQAAPPAGFRIADQKIPREPHRYSGKTAMHANVSVFDPQPPADPDSALAFSMEGYSGQPPAALIPRFWAPGWNSIQSLNKFQQEVGGALRGGDAGVRLIESGGAANATYRGPPPSAFVRHSDSWLVVPLHHIFGSDELSVLSPGIAELAARPYLALNADDAAELDLRAGDTAELRLGNALHRLPVRLEPGLQRGIAGLPVGLPGAGTLTLPAAGGRVTKSAAP
ncbi:MAG: NADH-quinone oxidoreductase subunit NuoG [Burkholderiales bacterium]